MTYKYRASVPLQHDTLLYRTLIYIDCDAQHLNQIDETDIGRLLWPRKTPILCNESV